MLSTPISLSLSSLPSNVFFRSSLPFLFSLTLLSRLLFSLQPNAVLFFLSFVFSLTLFSHHDGGSNEVLCAALRLW